MTKPFSRSLIISAFSLCLMPLSAFAFPPINPNTYFPGIAQGHSNSYQSCPYAQLEMNNSAKINGTHGNSLDFCSSNQGAGLPNDSCDNASGGYKSCQITGNNTPSLSLSSFQTSDSTKFRSCNSGSQEYKNKKYNRIEVRNTCNASIKNSSNTTYLNGLAIEDNAKVTLNSGDYWIKNLSVTGHAEIKISGNVRLFIYDNLTLSNQIKITLNDNASLYIIGYKNIQLNDNASVEGYIYANNTLSLNNNSHILGRVSSHKLFMEGDAYINRKLTPPPTLPPAALSLRLDENSWSGTIGEVKDSSGNDFNGTAKNHIQPKKDNPALPVDMANMGTCGYGDFKKSQTQYIEVPHNSKLSNEDTITVSAWINPSSYPSYNRLNTIVSKNGNYEFHLNSQGQINWYWELKGTNYPINLTTRESIPLNRWSHIVIRYDAHNTHKASIFINGVEVRSIVEPVYPLKHLKENTQPLQVGNDYDLTRTFDGLIDEVNVFDQALTDEQVNQLYQQRHPCPDNVEMTCYEDNFDSLTTSWVTSRSSGSFTPTVINGRLQLTQAQRAQSTASSYQYLYPALGNKIEVEFDYMAYGGNGADGLAIVFSDAEVTPQAGAFGGPLGYGFKNNSEAVKPGFTGGWLGIGLDEYGNYSKEGGSKNYNSYNTAQSIVLRGSGARYSGYNYITGTRVSTDIDNNNGYNKTHRYRITIDSTNRNSANVTVERSVVNAGLAPDFRKEIGPIDVLRPQYNQDEPPENFIMSLTGSTGQLYNTHEIDNFKVCALYSKPIGEQIDHFEFDHSGQGSTCDVSNVTLRACADESCSTLFTEDVDVTLDTNNLGGDGYWLNGNNITVRNGIANLSIGKPTQGNVKLDVVSSSPSTKPFSHTLCSINGQSLSDKNCTLNFESEGLTVIVPDKLANKPVEATIKGCGSSFTGTKNIQLWSDYITPKQSNLIGSPTLYGLVNNSWKDIGKQESAATTFALNFTNNEAKITLNYADAGQLQLNAKYQKSYYQNIEGSDLFISIPVGLSAYVTDKNNSSANSNCSSEDVSCSIFAHAGETFNLNVKAHAWMGDNDTYLADNPVTPNYAQDNLILDHTLIAPSQQLGGNTGNLSINHYDHQIAQGSTNRVPQSISEVGVFDISVTPPKGYLGSSAYQIKAANTGSIGRFTPAYFNVLGDKPSIQEGCNDFTYMGQTFSFTESPTLSLYPLSETGTLLQNYTIGSWWRYNNSWNLRTYTASPSNMTIIDSETLSVLGQRSGFSTPGNVIKLPAQAKMQLQGANLRYIKPFNPKAPVEDTITLQLAADDLRDQDQICHKTNASGTCLGYAFPPTDTQRQEWGRITMEDTYGSELNDLKSQIQTESYIGNRFVKNNDDCTVLSMPEFSFDVGKDPSALPVGKGTTKASLDNTHVEDGSTSMTFTAPGNGNQGQVVPTLSLLNLPWLQQDADNNQSFEDSIKAIIHFGIYRGSDRIIWNREQTN
ncbi:DUF6701 domain-containing protein [Aliivibrio fischeri]|uniref:DUF6701 domain-containing protein n=1 Tax=Aliivibrio fischeri TaxID=668 RepID=UPI0012DA49A6|nr:DUF6701 domain-containing protein [Aliivibrio fischeri]MUK66869.1 MSHA biogenesis protein MshQ [Aliivibrio fischeri]